MPAAAQVVIAIAAFITAATVICKAPPVRWVVRHLAVDPLEDWIGSIVDTRLDARPLTNGVGWKTVAAIADHLGIEVDHSHPADQGGPHA